MEKFCSRRRSCVYSKNYANSFCRRTSLYLARDTLLLGLGVAIMSRNRDTMLAVALVGWRIILEKIENLIVSFLRREQYAFLRRKNNPLHAPWDPASCRVL